MGRVSTFRDRHQRQLQVPTAPRDSAVVRVFHSLVFEVEGLRFSPNRHVALSLIVIVRLLVSVAYASDSLSLNTTSCHKS
jgi:hypothetical protein